MIYILSQKFFKRYVASIVSEKDYFLIDGENFGTTGKSANGIADNFGAIAPIGGFSPERSVYSQLKKKARGQEYSDKKIDKGLKEFFKSKDYAAASLAAVKAQCALEKDINVIIVLPNVFYKAIGKKLAKHLQKLVKIDPEDDFQFVWLEKDVPKKKKKILKKFSYYLDEKQLKKIYKRIKKLEKKKKYKNMNVFGDADSEYPRY